MHNYLNYSIIIYSLLIILVESFSTVPGLVRCCAVCCTQQNTVH